MAEDKYFGVANHLTGNYQSPPKEIWWRFCPGSYLIDWIKKDKKDMSLGNKSLGTLMAPIAETVKIGFEGFCLYGIVKVCEEVAKSPMVQQGIESLF